VAQATQPSAGLARGDWLVAALVALGAFAVRAVFLWRSPDAAWPHAMLYEGDAAVWAAWAQALGRGEPFEADLAFRTPGVAFLLHWLGLGEGPFLGAKLVWCAVSAATCAATYLVVARWFTRRAALIAATLAALSFGQVVLATSLNNEAPYALLVVLIAGATLSVAALPRWWMCAALGAMHGAAMLLRAEHLALVALLAVLGVWLGRGAGVRRALAAQAVVVAVAVLACVPWSLRSHAAAQRFNTELAEPLPYDSMWPEWSPEAVAAVEALPAFARAPHFGAICQKALRERWPRVGEAEVRGYFEALGHVPAAVPEWSLVSFKGPLDFALANDPRADGGFSRAGLSDELDANPAFSFARPSHARLVEHGYAVGLGHITGDPARFAAQAAEKSRRFADGATLGLFATNWPFAAALVREPVDMAVAARGDAAWWRAALLALLALGVVVCLRRRGGVVLVAIIAYRLAVTLAFYGYARQSAAIGPVLFAVMAIGADAAISRAAARVLRHDGSQGASPRARIVWICIATAVFAVGILASFRAPALLARPSDAAGIIEAAPRWAPNAFESNLRLELAPAASSR